MSKLSKSFYEQADVVHIARSLLGKKICTCIEGQLTEGIITETEAYCGKNDKACHAFKKRTKRTEVMYGDAGHAYVYLCYGIHHLFNIVTNKPGIADAILIRAIQPVSGIETMCKRRGDKVMKPPVTSGPGKMTQALGISLRQNKVNLLGSTIWVEDFQTIKPTEIVTSRRIGVEYAEEDALKPWRFYVKNNPWISKK